MKSARTGSRLRSMLFYLAIAYFLLFLAFPIVWGLNSSLRFDEDLYATPLQHLPSRPTFLNYVRLWESGFFRYIANSLIISTLTGLLTVVISLPAGYALARFRFRWKPALITGILVTQMMPAALLIVPLYVGFSRLGLLNSYVPLVLVYAALATPFSVLLLRSFMYGVPREIEEAAQVDGCSILGTLLKIVVPVIMPGLAATFIFAFTLGWNELILGTMLINDRQMFTLSVGLNALRGEQQIFWGLITAGAIVAVSPAIAMFAWAQRYLVAGLTAGAVKG